MPEVDPRIAAITSPSYWEPRPPLHNFSHRSAILRLFEVADAYTPGGPGPRKVSDGIHRQACTLLSQAALRLLDGAPVLEWVEPNKPLGTSDDTRYFRPGHVLLVDTEEIYISQDGLYDCPRPTIEEGSEAVMSALELFRRGVRRIAPEGEESWREWSPYQGGITWTEDDRVHEYNRKVDLFAVCPTMAGRGTSLGLNRLTVGTNGAIKADVPRGNWDSKVGGRIRTMWPAARIGQIINRSVNNKRTNLFRLRSAALCLRGSFSS